MPTAATDFNRSLLKVLGRDGSERPWRYTTQPTYNPDGSILTPGVTQQANGVFILLNDDIVNMLKLTLTTAEKAELVGWFDRRTEAQCAIWHVPVWAGDSSAVFIRVPAAIWDDPTTVPPLKVRQYFAVLFN